MKILTYPMDYEEWLKHPRTKKAIRIINEDFKRLESDKQLKLKL